MPLGASCPPAREERPLILERTVRTRLLPQQERTGTCPFNRSGSNPSHSCGHPMSMATRERTTSGIFQSNDSAWMCSETSPRVQVIISTFPSSSGMFRPSPLPHTSPDSYPHPGSGFLYESASRRSQSRTKGNVHQLERGSISSPQGQGQHSLGTNKTAGVGNQAEKKNTSAACFSL